MLKYLLRKAVGTPLVLLGASFLTYAMILLAPGDAALEIAIARYGGESYLDHETVEWVRKKEGLDQPLYKQYAKWLRHVIALDLGYSLVEETEVLKLIKQRFGKTLDLAVAAIFIALGISLPLGIIAGIRQGSCMDSTGVMISVLGLSIPNFWLGLLLIILFSVKLKLLPSFGSGGWEHMVLPAITLGTAMTAYITRMLRSAVIDARQSEYLLALRARGVDNKFIIARHVAKNALIPVITVIGLEIGLILEGAVMTETVFSWPGLGSLMIDAISNRDYPVIQGIVLFSGMIFVVINFLVDIICRYLDPRIRLE